MGSKLLPNDKLTIDCLLSYSCDSILIDGKFILFIDVSSTSISLFSFDAQD